MTLLKLGGWATVLTVWAVILTACVPAPPRSAVSSTTTTTFPKVVTPATTVPGVSAKLLSEARQYVFRARNVTCLATGTSFATSSGIVTNRHVASGASVLQLSTWAGTDFNAAVQSLSSGPDLALLSNLSGKYPSIVRTAIPAGTDVWAAGYPEGNQLSLKPGIVIDYVSGTRYGEPGKVMEVSNAIQPGNSGSPLFDSAGQVVGIVFAVETATGDGLAIPASTVVQYLGAPGGTTSGGCIG